MAVRNDNQQTKKKSRLPLFDIALLLLIAIAVAAGSYWVTQRGETETAVVQYTIRFEQVDNTYSGALAEAKELFSASGLSMGAVKSAKVSRSIEKSFDLHTSYVEGGDYHYAETGSALESDVVLTVRVTVKLQNGGYFVEGNRIAAGMTVEAMVAGYAGRGEILTVSVVEIPAEAAEAAASES